MTCAAISAALLSAVGAQIGQPGLATTSSKVALGLAVLIIIYVIPQLLRNIQWRSDYAMQVPNAGLIFSVAILMVTILALSSGNNLLYLVLAALLGTMIFSIISARLNLLGLTPSVHYPDHIFAGEMVAFDITLKSRKKILPSFSLAVDLVEERQTNTSESKSPEQKAVALGYFPLLPAGAFARSRTERCFDRRGVHPVTGFVINTGFPFGFIEQRRFIEWKSEIVVYPQPQPIEEFSHLLPMITGRIENKSKGSGSDLYAIRQYLSSDHHHHIDWKATAKTNQLMVREFTRDDDWRVTIVFDSQTGDQSGNNEFFEEKFERAITFAASLSNYFIDLGAEVKLVTANEETDFGTGKLHYFEILRMLAQLSYLTNVEKNLRRKGESATSLEIVISPLDKGKLSQTHQGPTHLISFEELD